MKKSILIATALLGLPVALQAQTPQPRAGADPFVPGTAPAEVAGADGDDTLEDAPPPNISLRYETFSLPLADAAALQRKNPADAAFYQALVDMVARKQAVQESFTMVRARSGEKALAESISETIYPTGVEPPELPNSISLSVSGELAKTNGEPAPAAAAAAASEETVRTPATPKDFETRNEGITFEVEPTLSQDRASVDLRCAPDHITRAGISSWGQGLSRVEVPQFESQRVTTAASLVVGKPFLLGTVNRPPLSKVDADAANRIWFAFVTADLARP